MCAAGGAGKDDPEELVEEATDAAAESRAVLGKEMRLVQRDKAKDSSIMAAKHSGAEDVVLDELLRRAEEEDEAAGVPVDAVQAGDERLLHDSRRKLINMV